MANHRYTYNGNPNRLKWPLCIGRKAKLVRSIKYKLRCTGGALDGEFLYLSTPGTLIFSINGNKGHYNSKMEWVSND